MDPTNPSKKINKIFFLFAVPAVAVIFINVLPWAAAYIAKGSKEKIEANSLGLAKPVQANFSRSNEFNNELDKQEAGATQVPSSAVTSSSETKKTGLLDAMVSNLSQVDQIKWSILESILQTKNDNDPRLDADLKQLSSSLKSALFEKYQNLPDEDRNSRGLVAFLIARNIESSEDAEFLKKIYQEPPCLSLNNCREIKEDDPHHGSVNQTTLDYPQLAALFQIEEQLAKNPERLHEASYRSRITQILIQAESYPVSSVSSKALQIRNRFHL